MVGKLADKGELDKTKLMDNYVTFVAGILRSVRFGAADAHATANMVRFNYLLEHGAVVRDAAQGRYRVDFDKMAQAVEDFSAALLTIQGDGDYAAATAMTERMGKIGAPLAADLERLETANIPVDIRFEQGPAVLDLANL
jgi:hypothetical protein